MPATPTTITPYADPRLDTLENYLGTDPSVMCSPDGGPDNDSFDNNQDTFADVGDIALYVINYSLNTTIALDGSTYWRRGVLNGDGAIDVGDIATYGINGVLNEACPYGL